MRDNVYYGSFTPLESADLIYFAARFHLQGPRVIPVIGVNDYDQYVMKVLGPHGELRGYNVRVKPWGDTVYAVCPRSPLSGLNKSKSKLYMASPDLPTQSFHFSEASTERCVLVEDQLSALKVAQNGLHAVALLGDGLNYAKLAEIQRRAFKQVSIALDKDATSRAFKMAHEYGYALPNLKVIVLEKDIKDMNNDDVSAVLRT